MVTLRELGDRICIMGPTNSGKSTLAEAIARKINAQAIHLDLLYHLPGTNWQPRPVAEFQRLHDAAIEAPQWVIEGNYSQILPQRLARTTGFILLDISAPLSLFRYLRRSLFPHRRVGALAGARDHITGDMLRHIVITSRRNRKRYAALLPTIELPKVHLATARQIQSCYAKWELTR